jgi:hypothetical protein
MDSALPHISRCILQMFSVKNIVAITYSAHTPNLFQALDFIFFGTLKKLKTTAFGEFDDDFVNGKITKLVQAYEQTAISFTIRGSFRMAGMNLDVTIRHGHSEFELSSRH